MFFPVLFYDPMFKRVFVQRIISLVQNHLCFRPRSEELDCFSRTGNTISVAFYEMLAIVNNALSLSLSLSIMEIYQSTI